ncbi:MAG: pre-peptidase C-terminal domain-containing protein [Prevotella sp.]|nr:pre-peptidase C-terminal domain-containing protein [Prevotella sp.]
MTVKQFILGAMMLISTTAFAQQQPAAETSDNTVPQQAQLFIMASELVRYGYAQKSALPLIQAVQIYKDLGVTDATTGEQKAQSGTAVTSTLVKGDAIQFDETKLLADATTFADGDKTLLALIKDTQKTSRGPCGPTYFRRTDRVLAGYTDTWTFTFRGGEYAYVIVSGDGDTDLDLYIYDENGNLIDSDTDDTDDCVCSFTPRWTGKYYIKIKNRGRVYNNYELLINQNNP